jgi:hypothetical protein
MTDSNFTVSGEDLSDIFSSGLDKEVTAYKVGNVNLKYRGYGSRHYLKKSNFVTNFLIKEVDLVNTFEQEIIDTVNVGTYGTDFNMIPVTNGCLLLMVNSCTITFKITHVNITAYIVGGGGGGGGSNQSNAGGGGGGAGVLAQGGISRNIKKIEFTRGNGGNGGTHGNSGNNGSSSVYKTTNTGNTTKTFTAYAGGGGGCGKESGKSGANGGGAGSYSSGVPSIGYGTTAANITKLNAAYAQDGVTLNCGKNGGSGQHSGNDKGAAGGGGGVNGNGYAGGSGSHGGTAYTVTIRGYTFNLGGGGGGGGGFNYGGGTAGAGGGNGGSGVDGADLTAGDASETGLLNTSTTTYGFGGGGGGRGNRVDGAGGDGGNGCCLLHIINSDITFP